MNLCSNIPNLSTISILNRSTRFKDVYGTNCLTYLYIFVILCCNSWNIESNPGNNSLNSTSHFPCGVSDADAGWEDPGIFCDTCNVWYHINCQGMSSAIYYETCSTFIWTYLNFIFCGCIFKTNKFCFFMHNRQDGNLKHSHNTVTLNFKS